MRERLKRYFEQFERALKNLRSGVETAVDELDIDGTIKRFELCYELSWKLIKEFLADLGIICKNPRDCFKQAYNNQIIEDEQTWLNMIDDRNELVHVYTYEDSRRIFEHIKQEYLQAFEYLYLRIKEELD